MLIVVALWGIPALIQTRGEFFRVGIGRHVVGRSFMTLEGHGASSFGMYALLLPFYFVTVFISFFPWSIKLPWLIRKLWRNREAGVIHLRQGYGGQAAPGYSGSPLDIYLLSGIAVVFVIFTLVTRNYRTTRCRRFRCLPFCSRAIGLKERRSPVRRRRLKAAAPGSQPSRSQLRVYGSQLPLWCRNRGAVFPRVSALSSVSRVFAAEHAICCGRVPGAKSGLVFSLPCPRFSHAAEQASRC